MPRTVRTLLGEKTLGVSLTCLPTLMRYSVDPVKLVIHEDGTLTPAGREALLEALPGAEILPRAVADEQVEAKLARHPLCRAARSGNVFFLKLFDVAMLEPGDLTYCDSDILFLRPFTGLFGAPDPRFQTCFMTDRKQAFAIRPWNLWPLGKLRLPGYVCAGLMRADQGVCDVDFVEWVLGRYGKNPVWDKRWYWAEQTCWAALAGRARCGRWDCQRVIMASPDLRDYSADTVAIHFVSTYRHHLAAYVGRGDPPSDPPVAIGQSRAGRVGPVGQFVSDFRARIM